MARLPQPGADKGTWGDILNEFLLAAHNTDGTLTSAAVTTAGAVTNAQLTAAVQHTDAVILYDTGAAAYPVRSTVTADTTRPVRWRGPVAPTIGGNYAVDNLDVWEMTP